MTDAKARLLQMIADEPHMAGGGLLKAIGKAQKVAKAAEKAETAAMRLYHGSPHVMLPTPENKLGKFDPAKMGTGEGGHMYGRGHYLAQSRDVAKNYRPRSPKYEDKLLQEYKKAQKANNYPKMEVLEDAMLHKDPDEILGKYSNAEDGYTPEHTKAAADYIKWYESNRPEVGGVYHVDLPQDYFANMLDYDKPINQHPAQVKALLEKAGINTNTSATAGSMIGGQEAHLAKHGIPGLHYDDTTGAGTRNFVVFPGNEDMLNIVQRDKKGGAVHMAGGGLLKALSKAQKVAKAAKTGARAILPAAERDANLAKMLKGSKVKDRLYHGTTAHDDYADASGQAFQQFTGQPTWLAKEPYTASGYAKGTGSVYPVHAQVKKPMTIGFDANDNASKAFPLAKRLGVDVDHMINMRKPQSAWEVVNDPAFVEAAMNAGHDAFLMNEGGYPTYGVFDPSKIKSAIGNRGTYDLNDPDINKAGGGLLKALSKAQKVAKATQPIVSAAEHKANLARLLESSKATMRLYHGTTATEGGKGTEAIRRLKPSKEGALGSGVYLTPNANFANEYAHPYIPGSEDLDSGNMLPVYAQIKNPLILEGHPEPGRYRDPMVEALTKLGMDKDKAIKMVERAYDQKGYIGKEVESRARAAGYDGIMQYRNGELSEVVSYKPNAIKSATGNQGTFDINDPDLSKATGGAVHMAGGGRTPKYPWERYPQPKKVAEMRARQISPIAGAVKKGADYATQLIDKGPSFSSLVGNLVGAVPFVGPDLRKRMEASEISIPTDFTLGSNMPDEDYEYGQPMQYRKPGISATSVPTKDVLEALNVSDLVGTPSLSKVAEDIGYGQMPDALDLLEAASVGALGYGAVKAGVKSAGALSNLAKSDTGYKLAQKALKFVPAAQPMYAVKLKGGNWVDTEVKRQLNNLKNDEDYSPLLVNSSKQDLAEIEKNPSAYLNSAQQIEILRNDIARMEETNAFNKWVDTKAGSYVRNQMGTPDDPVVKSIDMRVMKAQADLEAGQKRLASLDSRIAEAEKTAVTPDELNQLAGMKRNRSQRAAELQSNYDLTLETILPGGKSNQGYGYLGNHNYYLDTKRTEAGFPVGGYAQTRPGKAWEALTDANISINPAEMFQNPEGKLAALKQVEDEYKNYRNVELKDKFRDFVMSQPNLKDSTRRALIDGSSTKHMAEMVGDTERHEKLVDDVYEAQRKVNNSSMDAALDNPYLAKLPPEAPVYMLPGISELGIDHVIDVLKQDVAAGNIKLEDLNKITMEQALKRASEYDLDMAKKARDAKGQSRAAMPVYKEYPEGYRWVQLTKPGEFRQESEEMGHSVRGYEPPKGHPDWSPTSENSGSSMYGHGGWEAIKSGKAKVYSLVDADHKPHVTVEILSEGMTPEQRTYKVGILTQRLIDEGSTPEKAMAQAEKIYPEGENKQFITQIKGKGNARPVGKYDQYTQDFVKSGKWVDVFDLKNTGLIESGGKYFTEPEFAEAAKKYGRMGVQDVPWEVARQRHVDAGIPEDEAFLNWVEGLREGRGRLDIPDEPRMAEGGEVKSFFEEKSAKQRLLDMIAEEPHMGSGGEVHMGIGGAALKARKVAEAAKAAKKAAEVAAKAAKVAPTPAAPAFIPGLMQKSTAAEIGREERARRQAAAAAEAARVAAAKQTPVPVGYVKHTEKSPNPHVGFRFEADQPVGIVPSPTLDVGALERSHKGASMLPIPWDSTNRNVRVSGVSGEKLAHDIWSHGGFPYSGDEEHLIEKIGGASGRGIAKRIQGREMAARAENKQAGGTGEIIHAVNTMGVGSENYALPSSEFAVDIIGRRFMNGKISLNQAEDLANTIRNYVDPDTKKQPFKNWAGFLSRDGVQQIYTGEGLGGPPGDLRKLIAKNILYSKKNQELLNFNTEDFVNAITHEPLRGVGRGYIGGNLLSNVESSPMKLSQTADYPWLNPYDTNFSATHIGQLEDLVPIQAVMGRKIAPIEQELLAKQASKSGGKPYTDASLQGSAISALEKRKENVAQFMDSRYFQDLADYFDALKTPLEKKKGGLAHTKKVKRHGNTVSN